MAFEERKGAGQGLRGEMGAVAIQRDDTPAPRTDEDAEGGLETGRETIALLRDHLDAEPACQLVLVAGGAHDRDSRRADGTRERERVLDEATVERDDRLRRQHVREAGLHVARARRLRHDDERAIVERVGGHQGVADGGRRPCLRTPPRMPHAAPMLPRTVPLIFERPRRGW